MARWYGVNCKSCGRPIAFGRREETATNQITFYPPRLGDIPCPYQDCRKPHPYSSHEVFEFDTEQDIPLVVFPPA